MRYFDAVHGSRLDGSNTDKGDLIRHILSEEGLRADQTVMIGDRLYDIVGASKNGLPAIGVLWGYGDRDELGNAGPTSIVETPSELMAVIDATFASKSLERRLINSCARNL